MQVDFQKATLEHCETVLEMMREYYAFDHLVLEDAKARNALRDILSDESFGQIWLVKADEKIAGYAVLTLGFSLEFGGRDAFVDELYLRENFRGYGIGKSVLQFLEKQCTGLGVKALHLEVERENENAKSVYLKTGFAEHDRFLMTKWI